MTARSTSFHAAKLVLLVAVGLTLCSARSWSTQVGNAQGDSSQPAATQPGGAASLSLGELARRQRGAQVQSSGKPVKAYTNDNLPSAGDITILGSPSGAAEANGASGASKGKHGEEYYESRAQELQSRLEVHQRELEVLQQKLGENQMQFYPNPSQGLQQQYSREDINGDRAAIDQKQHQVDEDQRAMSDLEAELRRDGGDPQWLETSGAPGAAPAAKPDLAGVPKDSEGYWRRRLAAAREALGWASEQRQLAEDELGLLRSQQAHDWGTPAAESAESRIADKQRQVESKRAAEEQAQQELDALENEFQQSGAPEEWSTPSSAEPDASASPQNTNH